MKIFTNKFKLLFLFALCFSLSNKSEHAPVFEFKGQYTAYINYFNYITDGLPAIVSEVKNSIHTKLCFADRDMGAQALSYLVKAIFMGGCVLGGLKYGLIPAGETLLKYAFFEQSLYTMGKQAVFNGIPFLWQNIANYKDWAKFLGRACILAIAGKNAWDIAFNIDAGKKVDDEVPL